jgi:hypothetical protein
MIVFASNPDYIKTSYVTAEWEAFVHDINSDHKPNGKLKRGLQGRKGPEVFILPMA